MASRDQDFDTSSACPKCHGILRVDEYQGEVYAQCIQCGYLQFLNRVNEPEPQTAGHARSRHASSRRGGGE